MSKLSKEKYKNVQFKEKRGTRKLNPVFKEINRLKKRPHVKWYKGSGSLRARFHPAKLPI